jgi:hypothetical protein
LNKIVAVVQASAGPEPMFPTLKVLKLRHNAISESSLLGFLPFFPSLSSLDLAFTAVSRIPTQIPPPTEILFPALYKLMLTSSQVNAAELCTVLEHLPKLRKLHLAGIPSISRDSGLVRLTAALSAHCPEIEDLNLVRDSRVGSEFGHSSNVLRNFVRKIGRKCKVLSFDALYHRV